MQPSSKTPVVVAIITAIGGIIAALVGGYFVMQNTVLQKTLDLTMTAYAREQNASSNVTDTPYPNSTMPPIDIQPPSDTPQPIVVPIDTLAPQNVSIDTDLNSVLSVGETWTTNGLSVQLPSISFRFSDEMNINFIFINNTGKTLFFNFNESTQVTLKDDKGNIYIWNNIYEQDVVLENGDTYSEQVYKGGNFSGAQYFIIELNIPGVIIAKWRFN